MSRVLYYTQRSPYARKVRIILAEKNLSCDLKETDIAHKSSDFLALSPIGKVPVFVDEDGTKLWDSTCIVEYLDETYPEPRFYPSDRIQRVQCRQWEELADTLCDHAVALMLQKRKGDQADPQEIAKHQGLIDRLIPALEQPLQNGEYLVGNTWSAADVAALSALGYYTLRFGEEWQSHYPQLTRWFKQLHERESVQSTIPQL